MAKVTSKLQLTVPKAIADQYHIRPGDDLQWIAAGEAIRVVPSAQTQALSQELSQKQRMQLFDRATERQARREAVRKAGPEKGRHDRGWRREELYSRGLPR